MSVRDKFFVGERKILVFCRSERERENPLQFLNFIDFLLFRMLWGVVGSVEFGRKVLVVVLLLTGW